MKSEFLNFIVESVSLKNWQRLKHAVKNIFVGKKEEQEKPKAQTVEKKPEYPSFSANHSIETLQLTPDSLVPKVDWQHPPPQVVMSKIDEFKDFLRRNKCPEEAINMLFDNVRYLSKEGIEEALIKLAEKIVEKNGKNPYRLIFFDNRRSKNKSGEWYGERMKTLLQQIGGEKMDQTSLQSPVLPLSDIPEMITNHQIPEDCQFWLVDDMALYWEQIDNCIRFLREKTGENWLSHLNMALVTATDFQPDTPIDRILSPLSTIIRAYKIPTIEELMIPLSPSMVKNFPKIKSLPLSRFLPSNSKTVLTFLEYKIGDRVYGTKSHHIYDGNNNKKIFYFIDDMLVGPPYEPDRFTTGSWAEYKKNTDSLFGSKS